MCDCCDIARESPQHRMFDPSCLYCGARIIQQLGTLQIGATECRQRRLAQLKVWTDSGFLDADLRRLAKGPDALGPVRSVESAPRTRTKRR